MVTFVAIFVYFTSKIESFPSLVHSRQMVLKSISAFQKVYILHGTTNVGNGTRCVRLYLDLELCIKNVIFLDRIIVQGFWILKNSVIKKQIKN